jgi:hypothetical protein
MGSRRNVDISEYAGECQRMTPTNSGLLEDMLHVNLHRASLDPKFHSDLLIRQSLLDQLMDLLLALAQCAPRFVRYRVPPVAN